MMRHFIVAALGLSVLSAGAHERPFCFSADAADWGGKHDHTATQELPLNKGTHRYREIRPGETCVLMDVDGPGRIECMWFASVIDAHIRIWWDGEQTPSVDAPLADFFFFAYPDRPFAEDGSFAIIDSERVMVAPYRGLNCWWRMPFRRHCRIEVTSREKGIERLYHCISGVFAPVADDEPYFHARSSVADPVTNGLHEAVAIVGSGRFVGLSMGIAAPCQTGRESDDCFCEGPIKVYIDGERTPTFGYTGIEDYFGGSYGWGNFAPVAKDKRRYRSFSCRYVGFRALTVREDETRAHYRMYRIHEHDAIPFSKSFRMVISSFSIDWQARAEDRFKARHDSLRTVAYWYGCGKGGLAE